MQKESAHEFNRGKGDMPDFLTAVVSIPKGHLTILDLLKSAVGDRDTKHVAGQILQHLFTMAGRLAMHYPFLFPNR